MPVWEEEQLGNYSRHYPESMPLPEPTRPSEHNGMYLDVDEGGDILVGRAANGEPSNAVYSRRAAFQICKIAVIQVGEAIASCDRAI